MQGTYLLAALILAAFVIDQDVTTRILTTVSLKIQVHWVNWRMKRMAKTMHKQLSAEMKKHYGTELPPFKWVDLWNRKPLN